MRIPALKTSPLKIKNNSTKTFAQLDGTEHKLQVLFFLQKKPKTQSGQHRYSKACKGILSMVCLAETSLETHIIEFSFPVQV